MPSYTYSSTTEQFGVASENKILAIKVDTVTDTENWFSVLDQTTAASNGTFQLSWDDWNGRVIIGAVDGDTVVQLDCVFHDYITGTLVTVEEPADLPSNPAFHYAMDTITAIESVGAYTGTVIGTLTSATGKFENAIDTSTGGIDSGYLLQQGVTAYTVSLWFKTSSTPSVYGVLIQDGPGLSINDCRISLKLTDNNRIRLKMGDGTTNSQWYGDTAQFMAPYYDDNWHHMVLVINGTSQKVYVDNVEKAALISNGPAGTLGQENIHIGGQHRVASRDYFDGSMDQVRFYERALNLVEIAQLFNETLTTIPASVLNYTMENNTVSAVPDENGTYDGVITGSFPAVAGRAGNKPRNLTITNGFWWTLPDLIAVGDFEIEFTALLTSQSNAGMLVGNIGTSTNCIFIHNGAVNIRDNGGGTTVAGGVALNNEFTHYRIEKVSNTLSIYVNGATSPSSTASSNASFTFNQLFTRQSGIFNFGGSAMDIKFISGFTNNSINVSPVYNFDDSVQADGAASSILDSSDAGLHATPSNASNSGSVTAPFYLEDPSTPNWDNKNGTTLAIRYPITIYKGIQCGQGNRLKTGYTLPAITNYSFSMWIAFTSTAGSQYIICDGVGAAYDSKTTRGRFVLSSGYFGVAIGDGTSVWENFTLLSASAYDDGIWHHAAVVIDGTNVKLYLDNVMVAEDTASITPGSAGQGEYVIANYGDIDLDYLGKLDAVRIHEYALSPEQITLLFNEDTN